MCLFISAAVSQQNEVGLDLDCIGIFVYHEIQSTDTGTVLSQCHTLDSPPTKRITREDGSEGSQMNTNYKLTRHCPQQPRALVSSTVGQETISELVSRYR